MFKPSQQQQDSQTFIFKYQLKAIMQKLQQVIQQVKNITKFNSQFKIEKIDQQTHIFYSRENAYLIKDMEIDESNDAITATLQTHQNLSSKSLMPLLHYQQYTTFDGQLYIKAIYQYGQLSLKQEIKNRIMLATAFQEDQLWAIFTMVIKALCYLQQKNIIYGVLGSDKIFINQNVRLLDPSATATNPLNITQGRLYSPQIINDEEEIDMFKSDVYVLGLLMIEWGLLVDLTKEIQPDLNMYLEKFQQHYSEDMYRLVECMLDTNPNNRPTFQELKQHLVRQMELNTTQINDSACPLSSDSQDLGSNLFTIDSVQEEDTDMLFEGSLFGEKTNYIPQTQFQKAMKKYIPIKYKQIQPFMLNPQPQITKLKSPLSASHQNIPRTLQSNNRLLSHQSSQKNFFNQENNQLFEISNRMKKHKHSNSQAQYNAYPQNKIGHNHTLSAGNKDSFRCPTRLIKGKLVTNYEEESQRSIRQDSNQYQENSSFISNGYHAIKKQNLPTANKNDIKFKSCRESQQIDHTTYRNSRNLSINNSNRNSHSSLFTDPNFLRGIQEDIARISSTSQTSFR